MIEKAKQVREQERPCEAGAGAGGIMGVPIEEITAALIEAGREARRRLNVSPLILIVQNKISRLILLAGQRIAR